MIGPGPGTGIIVADGTAWVNHCTLAHLAIGVHVSHNGTATVRGSFLTRFLHHGATLSGPGRLDIQVCVRARVRVCQSTFSSPW